MASIEESPPKTVTEEVKTVIPGDEVQKDDSNDGKRPPPLIAKLFAVLLISCISFGSHWSSGVTGAMKSTIKKVSNRSCSKARFSNILTGNAH